MRGLAALALVGGLACGGESVVVPVSLALHPGTCTTKVPDQIALTCDSSVGAWVKRGDPAEPDTVEEDCVDFASNGQTLAGLPEILSSGIDLSGIGAGQVWLEIGMYSPSTAADGCPDISDLADQMVVYGRTSPTEIENASRGFAIDLFCYAVQDGSDPEMCATDCETAFTSCPDAFESGTCDLDWEECLNACPIDDEPCMVLCDESYDDCIDSEPTPCADAETACYDDCAGDLTCEDGCTDDYDACVEMNCETSHTTCRSRCDVLQQPDLCASAV